MNTRSSSNRTLAPAWQARIETLALAAVALVAGAFVEWPWLALAPLLAGLRYGAAHGVMCGTAQAGALLVASRGGLAPVQGPAAYMVLGWLLAGLVAGQFRDAWARRLGKLEARASDLGQRLDGLSRAYHAVKTSHDRLQRDAPAGTATLRDALKALRRDLVEVPGASSLESIGPRVLALFREWASVRAATLHPVEADGRPGPSTAALGAGDADGDDPLIRLAARVGDVVSVRDGAVHTGVLVAVPLVDVTGQVHAVVAVRDMPFLSLHDETLSLLAILGGHAGDIVARALRPPRVSPELRPSRAFCASVSRAMSDARRHGVPSSLAIVELKTTPGDHRAQTALAGHLALHHRTTDEAEVLLGANGTLRVVVLLRLADAAGLDDYLQRVEKVARERARELGASGELRVTGWPLEDAPLPRHPGQLEAVLSKLLGDEPAPDTERGHGCAA